jgi:hypothetical protein
LILFWTFIGGFCFVFNILRHSVVSLSPPGNAMPFNGGTIGLLVGLRRHEFGFRS